MDLFPGVMGAEVPKLIEPLVLPYRHFGADDLKYADALLAVIEPLESPADPNEAVDDTRSAAHAALATSWQQSFGR